MELMSVNPPSFLHRALQGMADRKRNGGRPGQTCRPAVERDLGNLRVDTVVETKLVFNVIKATGLCSTVQQKFLAVLDVFSSPQPLPTHWRPKEH